MADLPHEDLEAICGLKVDELFNQLNELTSNFLTFKTNKRPTTDKELKALKED